MSVRVILNADLDPIVSEYRKPKSQGQLDKEKCIKEKCTFYRNQEHEEKLLHARTDNGFVNSFLAAYNSHQQLVLRPDDIHLNLQIVYSSIINAHSEELRYLFVEHEKQENIEIILDTMDFELFASMVTDALLEKVKDKDFIESSKTNYTTTTPLISFVSNTMIMNCLKKYFSYDMIMSCGIPSVLLMGELEDWYMLREKYEKMKKFFQNLKDENVHVWYQRMDVIMDLFIKMRELGKTTGELYETDVVERKRKLLSTETETVEATEYMKEFWKYVCTLVPQGSGSDTILGGWISVLAPYTSEGKMKNLKDLPYFFREGEVIPKPFPPIRSYQDQYVAKHYYNAHDYASFGKTLLSTPFKLIMLEKTFEAELVTGFAPNPALTSNGVCVNLSSEVLVENPEFYAQKKEYESMGFYVDERNGWKSLNAPKKIWAELAKKQMTYNVMSLFNVNSVNTYLPTE